MKQPMIRKDERKFLKKHHSSLTVSAIHSSPSKHQQQQQMVKVNGPNTRSKQQQQQQHSSFRKVKSDNVTHKMTTGGKIIKSPGVFKKSKKILNKKTEFKCNICSFKSTLWYDVKIHLYKTHINPKFMRINNKNRKLILKQINRKILFRKKTSFIENECKYVLDTILDTIESHDDDDESSQKQECFVKLEEQVQMDYNKYCLYKCHFESCLEQFFVYKNQLKKHFKRFHRTNGENSEIVSGDEDEVDDEDEDVDVEETEDDKDQNNDDELVDRSYSDSDYDTDNESNLEKKLVKSKILNENDDLIEIDEDNLLISAAAADIDYEVDNDVVDDDDDDQIYNEIDALDIENENNFNDLNSKQRKQQQPQISIEEETRDGLPDIVVDKNGKNSKAIEDDGLVVNGVDDDETHTNSSGVTPVGSSITSPNETNDDDANNKFMCNLCKKQFEDRQTLTKHQTKEFSLKMLKKKKEARKKKWRDIHWKRKIDMSYIETTQFNSLSQNIADNLSFCIDGTTEDLKSYNKEVKDYLLTELGTETDLQMFLKCFPDLYEEISDQLTLPYMDVNLIRKANSYFAQCYYSPKEQQTQPGQLLQQKLTSSQAICSIYHCKNCRLKFRNLCDLIQHQRFTHNLDLKTTFDLYNYDYEQEGGDLMLEQQQQPPPTMNQKEKMLNLSPIGYLRCDPYAYIMNLYWDSNELIKCLKCDESVLRKLYTKHMDSCGYEAKAKSGEVVDQIISKETIKTPTTDEQVVGRDVDDDDDDEESVAMKEKNEIKICEIDIVESSVATPSHLEDQNSSQIAIKEEPSLIGDEKVESKNQQQQPPTHQHETRSRKRSSRLIEETSANVIMTNKRQTKSSYASEHFVFFDGSNSSYRKSVQNTLQSDYFEGNQQKSRQITATVASTSKKLKPLVSNNNNDDSSNNNDDLNDVSKSSLVQQQTTSPSLLVSALNSCDNERKKSMLNKRGKYQLKNKIEIKEEIKEEEEANEKRTSKRIKKVNLKSYQEDFEVETPTSELDSQMASELATQQPHTSSNKTSTSNLSQIVNTPQSDSAIKQSTETSSANTSFIMDLESNILNESDSLKHPHGGSNYGKSSSQFKCEKCSLEFTSANSVTRHQEKSCLRIHILYVENNKIKCPICGEIYPSTHHICIHISKYHGSLLGSHHLPPSEEAKKLYEQHSVVKVQKKRGRKKKNANLVVAPVIPPVISSNIPESDIKTQIATPAVVSTEAKIDNEKVGAVVKVTRKYTKRSHSLNLVNNSNSEPKKRRRVNKRNSYAMASDSESYASDNNENKKYKLKKLSTPTVLFNTKKQKKKYKLKNRNKSLNVAVSSVASVVAAEPSAAIGVPQKRKYVRKTLDNSEIPAGYKKKQYKCDFCDAIFKRRSKRNEHVNVCKNKKIDESVRKSFDNNSNDAVTIEKLFNEDVSTVNSNSVEKTQQLDLDYKATSLHEDECIIHDDDEDEDEIDNNNLMYNGN